MNNILKYKGYHAKIEFDAETFSVRGKIEGINDFVDFESNSLDCIESEFHAAVDDYLDFCQEVGKEPDKEYKGTFNIRIKPELHRSIATLAIKKSVSLNSAVEKAIEQYLHNENQTKETVQTVVQIFSETMPPKTVCNFKNNLGISAVKNASYSAQSISVPQIKYN